MEEYNGLPVIRRIFAVGTVTLAVVLAVMDLTIMNIALPSMSVQFKMQESDTIWILNAYQVSIIMCLLAMSSIGEIHSYKKVYLIGISLFTIGSLCCALSQNFTMLVLSRALQGVGASATMSMNTTLLRLSYPKEWLGKGIGLNATFVAIASVISPSLSAVILSYLSWRWLFIINLPLGVIAILIGIKALPSNIVSLSERKLPLKEIFMNAVFFGSMIMMVEGFSHNFSSWLIATFALLFIVVGYLYIMYERHQKYPLLPLDLLKIPIFSLSVLTSIASFTAQMLVLVSVPFYLENNLGLSETETGFLFSIWPICVMITAPISGMLIGKVHAGLLGGIGLGLLAIGVGSLAVSSPSPENFSQADFVWKFAICGIGFALFQSPNNNILVTTPPPSRSGSASGMLAMARLIGQTTGATLVALSFHLFSDNAVKAALYAGTIVAVIASIISFSRLNYQSSFMKSMAKLVHRGH